MTPAGQLNELITIQQKSVGRASTGEEIVSWTTVVANLPARVRPIRGREFITLRAAESDLSLEVTIRHRSGVHNAMRILWNSDAYEIREVIAGGKRNRTELTLMCSGEQPVA